MIDFELTEEQRALVDTAKRFCKERIIPVAAEADKKSEFPRAVFEEAWKIGLVNTTLPAEHGGPGLGDVDSVLITEELAYGLEDSGTSILIADQERAERAEGAFDTLGVRTVVVRSSGPLPPGADRLEDVLTPGAPMPLTAYGYLLMAIVAEVVATSALKATAGFTRPWPSVIVVVGYAIAFYGLAQTLKTIPVGIAYALWSGIGIVLVAIAGWVLFRQALDLAAMLGIALILAGVLVLNLFSRSITH